MAVRPPEAHGHVDYTQSALGFPQSVLLAIWKQPAGKPRYRNCHYAITSRITVIKVQYKPLLGLV